MKVAEFVGGCLAGKRIVEDARDEWCAVRRIVQFNLDNRAEVHIYRRGTRHFSNELSPRQREQIVRERGEVVYVLESVQPFNAPPSTQGEESK